MKLARALIFATVAVTLAGCSSGKSNSTSTTSTTTPSSTTTAAGPATAMNVTEVDFKITGLPKTLAAGIYTFKITNNGPSAHNLTINGPGAQAKASPTLAAGSAGDLTVTLQKGSYEFYCSVDSHKEMGMDLTVQVN
jgi:uncharacterized cupredoxin-like copper-binding protein